MTVLRRTLFGWLLLAACTGNVSAPAGPTLNGHGNAARPEESGLGDALFGHTGPRRLSNVEYDNTVRDLLGTSQKLAATFVSEEAAGFDNVAAGLGMTPGQYESYLNAADSLARELFADPTRRAKLVSCTPSGEDGGTCLGTFLSSFGTRAFRRPLDSAEQSGLRRAYQRARALGETELGALEHVTVAMLASSSFLYRSELSDTQEADFTRPLDGYELASRLAYFVWSTLPDAELFALAESGELTNSDVLSEQLERMLADARADQLIDTFAAQWLGLRELTQHKVLAERFPTFDEALRTSMLGEARAFVRAFLVEARPLTDFLRSEEHFVDERLARHYGVSEPTGDGFVRITRPIGERRGFTGLAAFLTLSSFAQRTSPTLRAKWILEELLCSTVPPPPAGVVLQLEGADQANAAAAIENVRERLALHRSDPQCANCHARMDPIGLSLEKFDGIGRARERYDNGDPIDTRGELPDGTRFAGPVQLADVLAQDPRFLRCATEKVLTFALQRSLENDQALIDATLKRFAPQGSFRALIEAVVLSEAFRQQREMGGGT